MDHPAGSPRVDEPDDLRDVIALVTVRGARGTAELVIGLDEGRVIRVVGTRDVPARVKAQVEFHERTRARMSIDADELYVMDVQAVEHQPDTPGADDPLHLYGVLRGPYPESLATGVSGIEGRLATTRGPLLDGLACGFATSFVYEFGSCGNTCTHLALPIDPDPAARSVVLAFPLVAMGDDGSNESVAAQLIHDVLGAMRTDLGDDLATDPVPVPSRRAYERDLVAAGWTIKGELATHAGGKGRFASLFSPGKKQVLPKEIPLVEYVPHIAQHLARLPRWLEPARSELHARLGIKMPRPRTPTPPVPPPAPASVQQRAPSEPPPIPPPRPRATTQQGAAVRPPPVSPPPPPPIPQPARKQQPRTVAPGLTAPKPKEWIQGMVKQQRMRPAKKRSRVTSPDRDQIPDWMFDPIDHDDDK